MFAKSTSFISLFCILMLASHAQRNLKEAVIVLNNGDSSKGYIDYKETQVTPSFIWFTTNKAVAPKRLEITDVSYVNITGLEEYQRYTVKASLDQVILSGLGDKDTSTEIRTAFLTVLVTGKNVTLFSYTDKIKTRYYLLENDGTVPTELLNTTYMANEKVVEEKQFQTTLRNAALKYASTDNNIISSIYEAGYYASSIESICYKINGTEKTHVKMPSVAGNQHAIRVFVGAGLNQGTLKVYNSNVYYYIGTNSKSFYTPLVDAGFDWIIKPSVGKTIIRVQLHAASYKTNTYSYYNYTSYSEQFFFSVKQTNVAFAPQVLYNIYNKENLKWFVNAGFGFNFSSYPTNQYKHIRTSSTISEDTNNSFVAGFLSPWVNACLGTGFDINRFEVAVDYLPQAKNYTRAFIWPLKFLLATKGKFFLDKITSTARFASGLTVSV